MINFNYCYRLWDKNLLPKKWDEFFSYHRPFWFYVINNAKMLFPVSMEYPCIEDTEWHIESYYKHCRETGLENFFALYFVLIIFHIDQNMIDPKDVSQQELWTSLWKRELWHKRVDEKKLLKLLAQYQIDLMLKTYAPIKSTLSLMEQ